MADKTFKLEVNKRVAKPRSKRLRGIAGSASTTAKSTVVKVTGAGNIGGGSEHTHTNKSTLDRISADEAGYMSLDVLTETTDSEGNQVVEKSAEKVKAGYADESGHAVNADEAAHALEADAATEAAHALKADEATEAAHAVNADYASEAGHALKADDAEKWNGKRMDELIDLPVRSSDEVTFAKVTTERVVADRETDGTVVSSGNFDGTSALTGTGYGIMKEGNDYRMAIDYLTVRKGMTVAELVIQEYKSVGGVLVVSACNGEIERVYKWDSGAGYDIYIKDFDKNPQFMAGDYVRCARWDSETGAYAGYWVKVTNIVTNSAGEKCLNLMSAGFPEGTEPQAGDKLVQFGNADDTTRQGLILISVEDGKPNITAYDGIDSADVDLTEKMCARLGNLNGMVKGGKDLQGYGLWTNNLYLHSETTQALTEIVAGLNAGIAAVSESLAGYKTEVAKEFEAADEKFTSAYKAATTAVGNLLLGTNQGARNWLFATDSANKPLIQDSSDDGVNGVAVDYTDTNTATGYEVFLYPLRPEKIVAGASYTLSVEVREHATEMSTALIFDTATSTGKDSLCKAQTSTQTTQSEVWVKFTFTFKAAATGASGGGQYIRLYLPAGSVGKMSVMELRNLMLAPGMEAMPWAKAPEDITAENLDAEVAVLEERASTIEQTVEDITQTVTQHTETLTAQGKRITTNETAIKQNADSITQTVTKIEGGMNNLLEGTNLGAEGWTAWCTGGGIVIGEEPIDGYDRYKAAVMTNANKDMTGTVFWSWHLRGDLIKQGKPYTLSFDVWQADTDEDEAFRFGARVSLGSGANADSLLSEVRTQSTVKGAWTHVCVTFAESPQDGTDPINGTENPEYCLYLNYIKKWTALKIKNLKFEEGAIGTPWTPAIKDADVQYTEIRQTAEGISMKLHESATAQNYAYGTGTAKIMTSGWNASGDTNFWLYDVKGFKTGDVVTVSFDIEISGISRGASTDYISMQFNKYYGYKATGFRFTLDKIDDTQTADFLTKLSYSGTLTLGQTTAEGDLAQRDITAEDVATLYLFIRKAEPFGENSYIKVSRLKVERGDTATAWTPRTGTIDQRLIDTGIDIESRKVTVTADNFVVRNNEGETTAMIDGNGKLATKIINADELITKRLIAVNEAGQVVSTINIVSQDGRYYTHYPVDSGDSSTIYAQAEGYNIGFPVSVMGYDAATDSMMTVYDKGNNPKWRLAVGLEDETNFGVVTASDSWVAVDMAIADILIMFGDDDGYDEENHTAVEDAGMWPDEVQFRKNDNGVYYAIPVYSDESVLPQLKREYKEFSPAISSAYKDNKGHAKTWGGTVGELANDFDFATGLTGVFLKTSKPVMGQVEISVNESATTYTAPMTWTFYKFENGVLIAKQDVVSYAWQQV